MLNKIISLSSTLNGAKATALSGLFLGFALCSFIIDAPWLRHFLWGSIIISGIPLIFEAMRDAILQRRINSGILVSLALVASLVIGELFAAAEIAFIMALGELLESFTVQRAQRGLEQLLALTPTKGRIIDDNGTEILIEASTIREGSKLRILPGETVPADGVIIRGRSGINRSILTGESLPVENKVGDTVFAGTLNGDGCIDIVASADAGNTTLQRLIQLVEEAGQRSARIQREADRWARYLVPMSLGIALIALPLFLALEYPIAEALRRSVTVLVVFCPCALALSTPVSIVAAIGQAARRGVIIKGGEALETLAKVDTIFFDKTGTLTRGNPKIAEIRGYGVIESEVLRIAGTLEQFSEHPLGRAVAEAASHNRSDVVGFKAIPGRGVQGLVDNQWLICGNEACIRETGVALSSEHSSDLEYFREKGMATIILATHTTILGIIALSDSVRSSTSEVLDQLHAYRLILLTGDNEKAASHFANQLSFSSIAANLLPNEKANIIEETQNEGHIVAMVGDGVNDAPALTQAHVGISINHPGSDIASATADIVLMNEKLTHLPYLMRLAQGTLNCIRVNIAAALFINFIAIVLGLAGILSPTTGAIVHNLGSFLVILNAALLYDRGFDAI